MSRYYSMLNESFERLLLEAQQVVIDFKNIFGADTYDRFKAQKQRMSSPENDVSYWVKKYKNASDEDKQSVIDELDEFVSNFENKLSRKQKSEKASEGAELIFEDDDWLVYHITTYEAAAKYGSHTRWCITGRFEGHEERGQYFFDKYLEDNYTGYYFFIKKGNDEEKYAVCPFKDGDGYDIWDPKDERPSYIPNGPEEEIPELPNLPVEPDTDYDYSLANEQEEDDFEDEGEPDEEEPEEPSEWTDDNGVVHTGERPSDYPNPELIHVENPNSFEFPSESVEDAVAQFAAHGFDGAEIVGAIDGTPLSIVHFTVEPKHEEFPQGEGDVYARDIPGDRYTAFVFLPGQGGGPLMTMNGDIVAYLDTEKCKSDFANMREDGIHRNDEREHENESLTINEEDNGTGKEKVVFHLPKGKGLEKFFDGAIWKIDGDKGEFKPITSSLDELRKLMHQDKLTRILIGLNNGQYYAAVNYAEDNNGKRIYGFTLGDNYYLWANPSKEDNDKLIKQYKDEYDEYERKTKETKEKNIKDHTKNSSNLCLSLSGGLSESDKSQLKSNYREIKWALFNHSLSSKKEITEKELSELDFKDINTSKEELIKLQNDGECNNIIIMLKNGDTFFATNNFTEKSNQRGAIEIVMKVTVKHETEDKDVSTKDEEPLHEDINTFMASSDAKEISDRCGKDLSDDEFLKELGKKEGKGSKDYGKLALIYYRSLHEGFFYFEKDLEEGSCCGKECAKNESCKNGICEDGKSGGFDNFMILVGDEPILTDDEDGTLTFNTVEEAEEYAYDVLELLDGDFDIVPLW